MTCCDQPMTSLGHVMTEVEERNIGTKRQYVIGERVLYQCAVCKRIEIAQEKWDDGKAI